MFYENVPPMIFTAAWSSDNMAHDIYLHATAAGGAAPFHWNVQCGDLTFSSVTMMFKDTTGNRQTKIGVRLKEPYPKEPLECEMRIADDGGNADRVVITIPRLFTPHARQLLLHARTMVVPAERKVGAPTLRWKDPPDATTIELAYST